MQIDRGAFKLACEAAYMSAPRNKPYSLVSETARQNIERATEAAITAYLTALASQEGATSLCSDCPREGYPIDETRCLPCPRRQEGSHPVDDLVAANERYYKRWEAQHFGAQKGAQAGDSGKAIAELSKRTFIVQHNPYCPSPWLVRLAAPGKSIDMLPYRNNPWIAPKEETGDILGFGKTFDDAARTALTAADATVPPAASAPVECKDFCVQCTVDGCCEDCCHCSSQHAPLPQAATFVELLRTEAPKVWQSGAHHAATLLRKSARLIDSLTTPPAPSAQAGEVVSFQDRVKPWMMACFGAEISADRLERGDRLLEEVLELLQSGDYPPERVAALTGYVFGRPKGEPVQEAGGVMVTLAAYCLAHNLDMHVAGELELERIWTKVEKIRAKQAAKPTGSALPVASTTPLAPDDAVRAAVEAERRVILGLIAIICGKFSDCSASFVCDRIDEAIRARKGGAA